MRMYAGFLFTCLALAGCGSDGGNTSKNIPWDFDPSNPIIDSNWTTPGDLLINDPSVINDGGLYRMWYSKGTGLGINHVKIYQASSVDGRTWTHDPAVLLGPTSDITVTGSGITPDVTGTYLLIGENTADFTNGRPAYKLTGQNWYLWYDDINLHYRISDVLGADGTSSWLGDGGLQIDGMFATHSGAAAGAPAGTSDWDSEKIETPMVLKVGGTYHMYYSGFKVGDDPGRYQTGHATSADGNTWVKDPANPALAYHEDSSMWGWYQVAEPGVVYNPADSTFYMYVTTAKYRGDAYIGTPFTLQQGIGVATSTDGSAFTLQGVALTQSATYPVSGRYVGYSTPFALIGTDGKFHLFYDVANYLTDTDWRQVALAHATSTDGLTFTEIETDIAVYQTDWHTSEVRAPCVLEEGGLFKMWFAGHNDLIFQPGFIMGIGYATRDTSTY